MHKAFVRSPNTHSTSTRVVASPTKICLSLFLLSLCMQYASVCKISGKVDSRLYLARSCRIKSSIHKIYGRNPGDSFSQTTDGSEYLARSCGIKSSTRTKSTVEILVKAFGKQRMVLSILQAVVELRHQHTKPTAETLVRAFGIGKQRMVLSILNAIVELSHRDTKSYNRNPGESFRQNQNMVLGILHADVEVSHRHTQPYGRNPGENQLMVVSVL